MCRSQCFVSLAFFFWGGGGAFPWLIVSKESGHFGVLSRISKGLCGCVWQGQKIFHNSDEGCPVMMTRTVNIEGNDLAVFSCFLWLAVQRTSMSPNALLTSDSGLAIG